MNQKNTLFFLCLLIVLRLDRSTINDCTVKGGPKFHSTPTKKKKKNHEGREGSPSMEFGSKQSSSLEVLLDESKEREAMEDVAQQLNRTKRNISKNDASLDPKEIEKRAVLEQLELEIRKVKAPQKKTDRKALDFIKNNLPPERLHGLLIHVVHIGIPDNEPEPLTKYTVVRCIITVAKQYSNVKSGEDLWEDLESYLKNCSNRMWISPIGRCIYAIYQYFVAIRSLS